MSEYRNDREMERAFTAIVVRNFPHSVRAYWTLQFKRFGNVPMSPDFRSILDGSKN